MPVLNLRTRGGGGMMSGRGSSDNSSMASGSKFKARNVRTNSGGVELSLYERLQQENELDEQKLQSQQQYNSSGNNSRGPMMDSDHNNITNSSHIQSDQQSVGSGWTWATRSTQSHAFRINQKYGTTHKSYIGSTLFGGENVITSRIKSAMNCNRDKSHLINRGNNRRDGKDEEEDEKEQLIKQQQKQNQQSLLPFNMMTLLKLLLFILILFMGIQTINKRKQHNSNSSSSNTTEEEESLLQISEEYLENSLRGASNTISELTSNTIVHTATFPQHLSHLTNLTNMYNPRIETPYFWDVHFSGESIAEHVFSSCYGLILACEFGLRQPDYNEENLETFVLDRTTYVNVDTTTGEGIQRASQLGLASSHLANIIISPHFHDMASQIFSTTSPGRMFALFRHPVDRAISMYYYLAKATWDPQYNPQLTQMSVEDYAKSKYIENNWLTRFLVSKPGGTLNHSDMLMAKKIIKFKCLVGLYDDIEASMARFHRYFGWNAKETPETKSRIKQCTSEKITQGDKNILEHPTVRQNSVAWNAIVHQNRFDMELYEYAKKIYRIQGEQIFDVVGHEPPPRGGSKIMEEEEEQVLEVGGGSKSMAEEDVYEGSGSKSMTLTMADAVEDNTDDEQDKLRTMDGV